MVSVEKNENGYVIGYIEFEVVDSDGQFENNGKYIYVQNIWIHPKQRKGKILRELSRMIYEHPYTRNSTHVYWEIYRDKERKKILESEEREWIHENKRIYQKEFLYEKLSIQRSKVSI